MQLSLDLSIPTAEERLSFAKTLDLNSLKPAQLDYLTTYILYKDQPSKTKEDKNSSLDQLETIPSQPAPAYTTPRIPIDWSKPYLQSLAEARTQISQLMETADFAEKRRLKAIYIDLSKDARIIQRAFEPQLPPAKPNFSSNHTDLEDHIDFTNSYHIKHMLLHYSQLRQSDQSKATIEHLDHIIDESGLESWQLHLIKRRIDGAPQSTIGGELARKFGKFLLPQAMSNHMRGIYRQIARTAHRLQRDWADRNNPLAWKTCKHCGKTLHEQEFSKGYAKCKACYAEIKRNKRKKEETQ